MVLNVDVLHQAVLVHTVVLIDVVSDLTLLLAVDVMHQAVLLHSVVFHDKVSYVVLLHPAVLCFLLLMLCTKLFCSIQLCSMILCLIVGFVHQAFLLHCVS